jgi:hypothetical protein
MNRISSKIYITLIALCLCNTPVYLSASQTQVTAHIHLNGEDICECSKAIGRLALSVSTKSIQLAKLAMIQTKKLASATKDFTYEKFSTIDALCKQKLHISCKEIAGYTIITVLAGTVVIKCYKIYQWSCKQKEAIAIWKKYVINTQDEDTILSLAQELPTDMATMKDIIEHYCSNDNDREQITTMFEQIQNIAPAIIKIANNIQAKRFEAKAQMLEREIKKRYAQEFECLEKNGNTETLHKEVARKFGFQKYSYLNYYNTLYNDIHFVKTFGNRLAAINSLLEKLERITNELFYDHYKQEDSAKEIDDRLINIENKITNVAHTVSNLSDDVSTLQSEVVRIKLRLVC